MDFGLFLPQPSNPEAAEILAAVVQRADEHGFRSVWASEHVVLFDEYTSRYPYGDDGVWPYGSERPWLEPFVLLTFLAARTTRIRLASGMVILPQRNPLYTAKSVSTLDFLSGGRVDVGVSVGWAREEYAALGVPFERRAQRFREYVAVMKSLWCDDTASFSGSTYELPPSKQRPAPLQKPHPPLFFGGDSDPALRRVAELGDGWFGWHLTLEQTEERIARLTAMLTDAGRDLRDVHLAVGTGGEVPVAELQKYAGLGVDQFVLRCPLLDTAEASIAELDRYAATYLAAFTG